MLVTPATTFAKAAKSSTKSSKSSKSSKSAKAARKAKRSEEKSHQAAIREEEETRRRSESSELAAEKTQAPVDLTSLAQIINSHATIGALTADLAASGFATPEERVAIESFLKDRGVRMESPLEKVKVGKDALRWSEITLSVEPNGSLKNSYSQILTSVGKTLDTVFGEAYLSFDRRSPRARAMDLFLQEAKADTGATPVARGSGALAAVIYSGFRAGKVFGVPSAP